MVRRGSGITTAEICRTHLSLNISMSIVTTNLESGLLFDIRNGKASYEPNDVKT